MRNPNDYFQNDLFDFLSDDEGDTAHPIQEESIKPEEKNHANPIQTVPVSEGDTGQTKDSPATDHRDSEPVGAGMAQDGEGVDKVRSIFGSIGEPGGAGTGSVVTAGEQPSGEARDSAGIWPEPVPTRSKLDFVIDADDIGQGGLAKKYRDNITAIRIIKAMEIEDRLATDEERKQIARYVGWGALKGVFDPDNKQWAKQHLELKDLLTDVEFRAARKSTLDAHYTSPTVISAMYDAMQRLGFTGGRILESSVGIGNFFGLMPTELRNNSQLHGVELDGLTSKLVAALYPEAKIKQATGFEDFDIPADYFDGCVGNPPFGSQPVVDKEGSEYSGLSIHNYFIAKSIDKLRPGGIMAVVVSHSFLDAQDDTARQWIWERAALIGAVRLPNTAFKENAGTEVVADILVFQKRDGNGLPNGLNDWREVMQLGVTNKAGEFEPYTVNKYFYDNRQVVLGKPSLGGGMYRANSYTVEPTGDLKQQLAEWVDTLPVNVFEYIERKADVSVIDQDLPESIKVGSFFVNAYGVVMQRGVDVLENKTAIKWIPPNDKATARMKGMIALRDSLRVQMRLERLGQASDAQIEANRAKMNVLYDNFLRQHGHLNNQTNRRLFLDDTESQLLQALEFDYDKGISKAVADREGVEQKPPSAVKADIFKRRVAFPPQDYINVSTSKDALLASLNYRGKVDLEYMAEVYNKSLSEIGVILEELGDVVYEDPQGGYVTADEYLSGDVKSKLVVAQAAALEDAKYQRNIGALEKVIPKDKTPSEISVSIGATFVPADVYEQYVKHISGGECQANYIKSTGQWLLSFSGHADPALNAGKFGTSNLSAQALFQMTLMGRGAIVKQTIRNPDGSTYTVVLEKETAAAREKQNAIKDEWKRWLWSDPERADRIVDIYNDKMNRIVNRKFDGTHLTFPGMNPAITLLEHQKNGVWRGLQSYQVLYDQVVGAGKTFEMATLAMEMRRLGISKKPLFVVPNHLTLQWRSEFTRLYPGSNILAATPEDFSKDNRERLFSKIVTGDWDAVIIGHSSLKKIGLPEETEKAVLQEQIDEIGDAIEAMKRERGDRHIIRDMEGIRSRLETKMKLKLASIGTRSKVVTFDELGVDALIVDEIHEYKNLTYNTTMDRNPGMGNPNGSAKAFDLFVKVRWLFDTLGDKAPFVAATGTPVSNSLVEMYNMQRYMQYPTLKREGLHVFDAWAKQFGSVENVYEVAPSGSGYRQSTRFAKFTNLPALMGLYNSFADTVTLDDLKAQEIAQGKQFPVPKLVGGKPVLVVAERSPDVAALMGVPRAETDESGAVKFGVDLANEVVITKNDETGKYSAKAGDRILGHFETEQDARLVVVEKALSPVVSVAPNSILGRFGRLKELTRETKGKVNALSLTGEANKAGLDYRLIDPTAEDFAGSKINLAVGNMLKVYHQWESEKGTQLVFCDMSIPLSARTGYLSKDRRLYVRDDEGSLQMKRGTLHTLEGHESMPYFVVQRGDKDAKRFDVFDAASGALILPDSPTKQESIDSADALLLDDVMRHDWLIKRETAGDIDQALIDDYNNDNDVETEGFEYFSREDIAGISGSSQFSVYDDIKAKLIANGVAKREIAFIHDYSTPVAKEKLFKAVNAGDIRFLLGSTPKLGAGTNVQKRLVGLHHIDAPWRPSDLEQREGRIIRRGNELYARDPENFAVFIGRYATEQTYDTRRWQILEHKARGIEQLRNFDGTINEIEDIDGEASNSADMKAAASGDPLILEETKLRNSVRRLEQLQASHADEVLRMSRKARDKKDYAETYGPRYLADLGRLIDTVNKHPLDKDNFSPISVNGKVFANRELAQDALSSVVNNLRGNSLRDATVAYRGIEFTLDRHAGWIGVSSETGSLNNYSDTDLFSSNGFIQRMANYVSRLPSMVDETKILIQQAANDASSMRKQITQEFSQASELDATREAYKSVQRALLAKGPVVPDDQKEAVANGIAGQKALLVKLGFGEELNEFFKESSNEQPDVTDAETRLPDTDPTNRMDAPVNNYGLPPISSKEVSMNKKAFHEVIAEKLIEQLQQGTAPWQRPWQPGEPSAFSPMNPITGKRYRGINAIQLMMEGRSDQRWLTYKQAVAVGGQVMKGEKGTPVQYWKFTEEQVITDENGKPLLNDKGEKLMLSVKLERPRVFFATVFNAEQIEGLPPIQPRKEHEWNAVERAERILQASGAVIRHSESDRAFYRLSTDSIHLPPKDQFERADRYYATALHELGHWSGASQRLGRDLAHPFGSEGYSKEELRAEIFSMLLGDELGIGHDPGQHAAYVASWVAVLKNDPLEIFRAAADAEKIQDYVLSLEQTHLQEQSVQTETDQSVVVSTNQETNMQASSIIAAQDNFTAYQAELARLLKLSTLTPGNYEPSEAAKTDNHAAVFVGDEAVILCGPSDDPLSVSQADALAASPQVQNFYRAAGYTDQFYSGVVSGSHIQWGMIESAIVSKPSGLVELGDDIGPLIAVVLNDPKQALTTTLCVTTATARILDPDVPELDNGKVLPSLASIQVEEERHISAIKAVNQSGFAVHELTSGEFLKVAIATPLVNHGRKWEVFVGEQSFGFADGDTAGNAMREVHKREVNNALYSLTKENTDNTDNADVKSVPPGRVLNEYPDLVEKFANALPFNPTRKTVINVPFKEKDEAKALGAKWDRQEKSWYVLAGVVLAPFDKWMQKPSQQDSSDNMPLETARFWRHNSIMALKTMHTDESLAQDPEHLETIKANKAELKRLQEREAAVQARYARFLERRKENAQDKDAPMQERVYLAVPYGERAAAKAAGAVWDKTAKSWYVGPGANMSKLERWKPDNVPHQQGPAMRPEEEFSEALRSLGCVVSGDHPIMDGAKHRITVDGDKSSEKSGFYVGHLDGHPAGYIKNNRTGVDMKWKSKGYALDPEEKAQMQAEAANKLREREIALQAKQKAVAVDVVTLLGVSEAAPPDHPYLVSKQARAGELRVVPPASTVLPDNTNIIIGKDWKESAALRESHPDKLVFTEGDLLVPAYDANGAVWTAQTIQGSGRKMFAKDSVKQANFHVVGGNGLDALANAPAIVIGEGYATADSLSNALGFPTVSAFDSGNLENVAKALHEKYPDKPIIIAGDDDKHLESTQGYNPGRTKASDAAKAVGGKAIFPIFAPGEQATEPKKFCDFNDLATNSALGADGIKRQVCTVVYSVIEKHLARVQQQAPVMQKARVAGRGR
jgi:N12 class adenine-specific DNA methylase/antirestriction protein ArdC/phage/plasmid primase-like uncharacterized protein